MLTAKIGYLLGPFYPPDDQTRKIMEAAEIMDSRSSSNSNSSITNGIATILAVFHFLDFLPSTYIQIAMVSIKINQNSI
ncbi:MAG: hypothetical protein ABJB76_12900 [Candidatus Nitrosocosmicus sp.]